MSEPQVELREPQPYLGIHEPSIESIRKFADSTFPELFGWLQRARCRAGGPALHPLLRGGSRGRAARRGGGGSCGRRARGRRPRPRRCAARGQLPDPSPRRSLHERTRCPTWRTRGERSSRGRMTTGSSSARTASADRASRARSSNTKSARWTTPTSRSGRPSSPTSCSSAARSRGRARRKSVPGAAVGNCRSSLRTSTTVEIAPIRATAPDTMKICCRPAT